MTYSEAIGIRIVELCKKRKITVNKLASMCGMTQSTLNGIVSKTVGSPELRTVHRIANGLSMTVSEFLDFDEMNNMEYPGDSY